MSTAVIDKCEINQDEMDEIEEIDVAELTIEFIDFASKIAGEIYADLNNTQGRDTPKDPDVYHPVINPNGKGKAKIMVWYFVKTGKSPFKEDPDRSKIKCLQQNQLAGKKVG